ncbi:MAG TPA: prolyl oligopeptidase family serine peptidase [Herpetosiphonaceae bacterium]|nr:prolyl oligopeptidase family serine peptidase [Herpetosiphonaceae bacterium]
MGESRDGQQRDAAGRCVPAPPQTAADAAWKNRYRAQGVWWAEIASGAPARGLVVGTGSGIAQLYAWDTATGGLAQRTHDREGVFFGTLSPDGRHLYYLRDSGGNETGHYVRVPWEGGAPQDITPDMPPYAAVYQCAISADGTMFAFIPTEPQGFPLYCLALRADGSVGAPRELYRSPKLIDDVCLSPDAALAAIATTEHATARQYSLAVVATADGRPVATLSDLPGGSLRAVRFSPIPGDRRLLCTADRSGHTRPLLWDIDSGERHELELAEHEGDIEPLDWTTDGRRILLRQVTRATHRLLIYDLATGDATPLPAAGGTVISAQFGEDRIVALWSDATHLPQVIALDAATGAAQGAILSLDVDPPARPLTSISFRSADGTAIQGWLGVPDGAGPFPTILAVHGGPHMAVYDAYDPEAQAWLDHGYAFLSINYRGSTTFGRTFKEQVWGDMGNLEVEDMVAARDWLIAANVACPEAILVTGASYGGYLTLMALGKRPELWAGGLALVSSADLVSEYEDGTDWSKGYLAAMMGGTPADKPEQYAASSPITYAARVAAPLLAIQGRNDLRCPPRQMERYAETMRSLGKPFEIEWFDAGHAAVDTEQFIGFQERFLLFADRILRQDRTT